MTKHYLLAALSICGTIVLTSGCGGSGSSPNLPPEIRFEVSPAAGAQPPFQFQIEPCNPAMPQQPCGLVADGVLHDDIAGTTFTATAPVSFILENAQPPYSGTFRQVGGTAVMVHLLQQGTGNETSLTTSGDGTTVTVSILGQAMPVATPNPEVRFDVCAESSAPSPCFVTEASGSAGQEFRGSIGDPFITYLIGRSTSTNPMVNTPAVFYFEDARDTVNAGFTGVNSAHLFVRMFINGQLRASEAGTDDLTFRQDL